MGLNLVPAEDFYHVNSLKYHFGSCPLCLYSIYVGDICRVICECDRFTLDRIIDGGVKWWVLHDWIYNNYSLSLDCNVWRNAKQLYWARIKWQNFFQILDPNLGFLVNRSCVRLHLEWLHSCLLFQSTYSRYDDVTRIQTYQMRSDSGKCVAPWNKPWYKKS